MAKNKKKNKLPDAKLNSRKQNRKKIQNPIERIQSQITSLQNQKEQEKKNREEVSEIEKSFKKRGVNHLLSLNMRYTELKKSIKITSDVDFEKRLSNLRASLAIEREKFTQIEQKITNRKVELKKEENLKKLKKPQPKELTGKNIPSKRKISQPLTPDRNAEKIIFDAEWKNVGFADGFITIEHNRNWYRKDIPQSKIFLNTIKHFYTFHNIPKLKIIAIDSIVQTIENQEILFYHIDFLSNTASNFGFITLSTFRLNNWRKYTKQHYKTNLPFLFHTHTLKKLCEYCDPNLPIIPVGEAVVNISGTNVIHNSFLFPMKSKAGYTIVWESIEEAKASYVFSLNSFADRDVQILFDYIAGDTPNKRQTLINSKDLQIRLKMKRRLLHTDLSTWDNEIRLLCR